MSVTSEAAAAGGVRQDGDLAAQLAAVVASSHDAIIGMDLDGVVTSWNPGAERLYGYLPAEVVGRRSSLLSRPEFQAAGAARLVRVGAGERIEMFGVPHLHKGGGLLEVSLTLAPIFDDSGLITGVESASREVGELARAQDRSQRLMDAALAAMLSVDADGIVTLVSDEVELLFGYSRSELIGQPVEMLIPTLEQSIQAALLQGFVAQPAIRPIGGPQLSARRKDGTTFPADISLSASDIAGRLIVTLAVGDVTSRIAADGARRDSEARARQLAASIDVAFVLRSLNPPAYLYVSPGYEKIFGYNPMSADHDRAASLQHIHPQDDERFLIDYWNPTQVGLAAQAEYRIIRADGEVRWVRSMTWPIIESGNDVSRTADTVEDITERRLAEAAIRSAHAQAEKARGAKDEFLSRTSHELRTPLNGVLGFAQLLELGVLSVDQRESVAQILQGGRHLLALIDDVLDIAMIESDRLELSMEPVMVSDLLTETVQLMTPLAEAAGVTLHFREMPQDHRHVHADIRRLRQVLLNLLSNGIKYNRRGGRVDIRCDFSADARMNIVVEDTGVGIRGQDLPRLFTPFDRLGAQATGIQGTGVGLALSHRLMVKMGGTLQARSRVGVGTTFTAGIPVDRLEPLSESAADSLLTPRIGAHPGDDRTRTVVYIEDNSSNIQLMERLVSLRPQWRLIVAGHARLGLKLAATSSADLVLLDLHLPDMDGIDVLHLLLADPRTDRIPVVVVSADANPHQISRLLAAGAQQYLTKPLDLSKLLQLLDTPLQPAPASSAASKSLRQARIAEQEPRRD